MISSQLVQVVIKTAFVFFLLLVLTRIMGKKLIAEMTYFDFATAFTVGAISGVFVTEHIKGYYIMISPIVFTILAVVMGWVSTKNVTARKLIDGEPLVLIQNGKIYENNMRKIRYNTDQLLMQLRAKGTFNLGEVEFAILEPDGELSVLKKSQYSPITPKDLKIDTAYKGVSSEMIRDGKIVDQNLLQNNLTREWLYQELGKRNIADVEQVFLATLSTDGKLFVDLRDDSQKYIQKVEDDNSVI